MIFLFSSELAGIQTTIVRGCTSETDDSLYNCETTEDHHHSSRQCNDDNDDDDDDDDGGSSSLKQAMQLQEHWLQQRL